MGPSGSLRNQELEATFGIGGPRTVTVLNIYPLKDSIWDLSYDIITKYVRLEAIKLSGS